MRQYRDLSLMSVSTEIIVIACDTSASIGQKEHDQLQVPNSLVGQLAARVVLLELLAVGAKPELMLNLAGNEKQPTAEMFLQGIQAELYQAGLSEVAINGSTEENMSTTMSALAVTLIGKAKKKALRIHQIKAGHYAFQVGLPLVGPAVLRCWQKLPSYDDMLWLNQFAFEKISEIVPIGSKGSLDEGQQVARENDLQFLLHPQVGVDTKASAGPATSWLIVGKQQIEAKLKERFGQAVWCIGSFSKEGKDD